MSQPFTTDQGAGATARLGLIVLATDETLENELRPMATLPGVALYHSRIPSAPEVTRETLARMEADLPATAALLPPGMDAIGYGCTSGATVIGRAKVAAAVHRSHPTAHVTDPVSALLAACIALGVRRLGFVTPYLPEVTSAMRDLLTEEGLDVGEPVSFEQKDEAVVARIDAASTLAAIRAAAARGPCDAIFASCTNLRGFGVIEAAEAETGKPVLTSNLALGWHLMRLGGVSGRPPGAPGRIFEVELA